MKFAIYTRGKRYLTKDDLMELLSFSKERGVTMIFNHSYALYALENYKIELQSYSRAKDIDADFVISYGGDGTFLHCVAMLENFNRPVLGINSGRLGFLTSGERSSVYYALDSLLEGRYTIEQRSMIEVSGDLGKERVFPHIFNEFTLQKHGLGMLNIVLEIDSMRVAAFSADGIIVSTPTGSTAYSLSAGGAILAPNCRSFVITPIAPHNLTLRPIVVDEGAVIRLWATSRSGGYYATLDNRSYLVEEGSEFVLRLSPYKVSFVKLAESSFFETIRKKLKWGQDLVEIDQ